MAGTIVVVSATETVPDGGMREVLGIARGNTAQARTAGRDVTLDTME